MIGDILEKNIRQALDALSLPSHNISLEHPTDLSHGDYSTNVAMVLAKETKQNPKALAEEIIRYIVRNQPDEVERVEVAGPGFINFHLSRDFFTQSIGEILNTDKAWGSNNTLKGEKVMIEYTDPNPFKEFHIGHLMSNTIGESLSRIVEFSGAEVKRANYQGDVGLHVAKVLWALLKTGETPDRIEVLGKAYARGAHSYEEDEEAKKEINDINKKVYEHSDSALDALYHKGRSVSLAYFETLYKKLGTHFDHYFFESEASIFGIQAMEEHKDVFEKSDGAVIFRGDRHGLHTRVFINSEGLPTYEAKELGLAQLKYDTFPYDLSLVVTGNEIVEYFKVLLKAMEFVFPKLAQKTTHVPHGMLRLPTGKMSSRTGDVITAPSLIALVQERVFQKMKDSDFEEKETLSEQIAIGAIKYSILKHTIGRDIIFDFEKSLSFEGDSGPYLQYAHTRAQSVLEKSGVSQSLAETVPELPKDSPLGVRGLERLLYQFPEIVLRSVKEYEPHHIVIYLTELAGGFNAFYATERILEESDTATYKTALTKAFQITMRNGLSLLGISTPKRM